MTGALSRWRAVLRLAARDAGRHKARSLLVVALVGLPVLIIAGADIAYQTWQLTPAEKVTRQIGAAQAGLQFQGGPISQLPGGWLAGWSQGSSTTGPSEDPDRAAVSAALPKGSRVIPEISAGSTLQFRTPAGLGLASITGLDYADPIAQGLVHQVSGRAPDAADEVALTTALAARTGLRVGDTLDLTASGQKLTIVGTVHDADYRDDEMIYALPATVTALEPDSGSTTWLVHTPTPVDWITVKSLNAKGFVVLSRQVYLHPPSKAELGPLPESLGGGSNNRQAITFAVLVAGMALLEVVLLAGPAFAVGARRRRRELALLAAAGARRSDLRNTVLASGVVLGAIAGGVGALASIGLAAVGIPLLAAHVSKIPGSLQLRPLDLAVLALVGLVTATAAAAFPARSAARADVVAALAGRRGDTAVRRRFPVAGIVVAGLGVVVALAGATRSNSATIILVGVILIEFGLIAATPALLALAARLGLRLPLAPRLALRDAGRNRSAATPAVAAVMASVIGAVAIIIALASSNDQQRRSYQALVPSGHAWVALDQGNSAEAGAVTSALRGELGSATLTTIQGVSQGCARDATNCTFADLSVLDPQRAVPGHRTSNSINLGIGFVVDDGRDLAALFGTSDPAAYAALQAGHAVVTDPTLVAGGQVSVAISTTRIQRSTGGGATQGFGAGDKPHTVTAAAIGITPTVASALMVIPPSLARAWGLPVAALGVMATPAAPIGARVQQAGQAALNRIDPGLNLYVESGYQDSNAWLSYALLIAAAVIAVGAAMIATALADVDSRGDLVTLGSVGASPGTRRRLSMSRAGAIAGIGTGLGVAAGFVAPVAWVLARRHADGPLAGLGEAGLRLVIPWPTVLTVLVGIPVVTVLVAGAVSRSRLPSERP